MEFLADKDALACIQAATDYPLQRAADGRVVGHFFHCRLTSVFQPVFDISERQVVGHAAYVRSDAIDDGALSPWGIFALAAEDPLLVRLDRLCRTLHALNYFGAVPERQILFLAVQPRLLESVKDGHGRAFEKVLDLIGVETSRVVIEIPPEVNQDRRLLKHVIVNYRSRGYRMFQSRRGQRRLDGRSGQPLSRYRQAGGGTVEETAGNGGAGGCDSSVRRDVAGQGRRDRTGNGCRGTRRRRSAAGALPR